LTASASPSLSPALPPLSSSPALTSSNVTSSGGAGVGWDGPVLAVNDVARVVLGIGRVAKHIHEAKTSLTREFKDMYADITRLGKAMDKVDYHS
jgi:hypothetical protein